MIHLPPETVALAQRLASVRGITIEDAVKLAIEQSAREAGIGCQPPKHRDRSAEAVARRKAQLEEFADDIASLPVLDPRSPREITDDLNAL